MTSKFKVGDCVYPKVLSLKDKEMWKAHCYKKEGIDHGFVIVRYINDEGIHCRDRFDKAWRFTEEELVLFTGNESEEPDAEEATVELIEWLLNVPTEIVTRKVASVGFVLNETAHYVTLYSTGIQGIPTSMDTISIEKSRICCRTVLHGVKSTPSKDSDYVPSYAELTWFPCDGARVPHHNEEVWIYASPVENHANKKVMKGIYDVKTNRYTISNSLCMFVIYQWARKDGEIKQGEFSL